MISLIAENWVMIAVFSVILLAIVIYVSEALSLELTSVGVIVLLLILFEILPDGAPGVPDDLDSTRMLLGFANPALISIMALLVIGQGLFQTGALESPSRGLMRAYERAPRATLLMTFLAVFVISAFINNTPVVVMFLPIVSALAARMDVSASKLMIPLSFVSIFAGMTTLIGTSTNLLAAERVDDLTAGVSQIGFFDLTPIGLMLTAVGALYLLLTSSWFLPDRKSLEDEMTAGSGKQFIIQVAITPDHPLRGKTAVAGMFKDLPNVTIRLIQRGERAVLPPFEGHELDVGDLVILAATRKALSDVLSANPDILRQIWQSGHALDPKEADDTPKSLTLTEAVVAPGSRMINRTIEQAGLRTLAQTVVLGIQRRSRMIRTSLNSIRLEQGDTLLLATSSEGLRTIRANRDLLVLEGAREELPVTTPILAARAIATGVVILAATGALQILHAALLGAVLMIASGCLNIRQASRALDLRIFLLIAAAIAMGDALELTGGASLIAEGVVRVASPFGPLAVLSVLFLTVALMTNILSNAATAVLFTPIAVAVAGQQGADPMPFVLAVIYAANCCFATPIAYQTNLLVMGPGHYKFGDYIRFGGPLVLLMWLAFTVIAPWRFNL